ncbi:MAG: hypothetical protein K2P57_01945 [Burkholderiales bacterium]|nr:hypothetical protein [Burkholderiales bacterium]
MKHEFLQDAEAEYLESVRFYEERQTGLGAVLISEFEHALFLALERPQGWRLVHPSGVRCIGLSRFPYAIFYRVIGDTLQITAFAHHRKRPGYWISRLGRNVRT